VSFQREVRPILADRCFSCHGPDQESRQAELRLDLAEEAFADRGGYAAIIPGDLSESELVYRIHEKGDDQMPPTDSGLALSESEVDLLTRWVEEGAQFEKHWAFQSPEPRVAPRMQHNEWARDGLDLFIGASLQERGVTPNPEVDRRTWLRRASFGLTGLPPSQSTQELFLSDQELGAYERATDRLLASAHFGERMAQGWLDLARYADTYGYQNDVGRRVWPYRDWVIQAYNDNLPYDEFVRHQLAGDLIPQPTISTKTATAFNRLHRQTNEGGSVEEEFRSEYVADRVNTFGTTFLGATLECARCHDHRYDPFSQREYYQLSAFFDQIDESGLYSHFTSATPTPAVDLPTPAQEKVLAEAMALVAKLEGSLSENASSVDFGDPALATKAFDFEKKTVTLNGDDGVSLPGSGAWKRSDPFAVSVRMKVDREHQRAVVVHRSRAWTDAGSQGWQVLLEEGRAHFSLVHFWPGDAVAIRTLEKVPVDEWFWLTVTSDGSSKAAGLSILLNHESATTEVLRDHLTRGITGGGPGEPHLGSRFRDRGLTGGEVDQVLFFGPEESGLLHKDLSNARLARDQTLDGIPQLMGMEDAPFERPTHVLFRGLYDQPVERVFAQTPAAYGGEALPRQGTRLELAEWLLDEKHPLTARVEVNRIWTSVFGQGLVRTPDNFGIQGLHPTHEDLLDYLAQEFRSSGWDRKKLFKRLVLSATFRQESSASDGATERDPDNAWWGRGPSYPLSAEMVRDQALLASGLLVPKIGGPSVFPYQPPSLWKEKSGSTYPTSTGEGLYRRSLYTYWKRTSPPPMMMLFDAVKKDVCRADRSATNTPLQALVLWNDPQFSEAARVLAGKVLSAEDPLLEMYLRFVSRAPSGKEREIMETLFTSFLNEFQSDPERVEKIVSVGHSPRPELSSNAEHAAWTLVCSTLLSSDSALTVR